MPHSPHQGARINITAKFFEDDRQLTVLTLQGYSVATDKPHNASFSFCRRGNRDVAGIRRQRANSWLKGTPFRQDKRQGASQAPPVATLGIQPDRGE